MSSDESLEYPRMVTREEFDAACASAWSEIEYQNTLSRRTADEAKDPAGFYTLLRRYLTIAEANWADHAGCDAAKDDLRRLAGIAMRGMVYCGHRKRTRKEPCGFTNCRGT